MSSSEIQIIPFFSSLFKSPNFTSKFITNILLHNYKKNAQLPGLFLRSLEAKTDNYSPIHYE